ncbi:MULTISPECIES: DUF413 domain-containing protein [Shewanella]|uniref:DUF413 domain-containing protein n=1 Tax=Shewanella TaxID=22 RepID=UPI000687AC3D|nr:MULTISPECIES: DUF413 domain-containing protein [Shewanella]
MSNLKFRLSASHFYDDANFPRGFNRCGEFTRVQAELLTLYGLNMRALAAGMLLAENEEEQHFINVVNGIEAANTLIEFTWLKYMSLVTTPKRFFSLSGERNLSKQPALMPSSEY